MNVLILTGKFGMGHLSVAHALQEEIYLTEDNVNVEVLDMIEYLMPHIANSIYRSFDFFVKNSSNLYNKFNSFTDKYNPFPFKKFVEKRIQEMVAKYQPDLIVSTVPGFSKYISYSKEKAQADFKLYTYITDITVHDEWLAPKTDLYFVGSEATKNELIKRGVGEQLIKVTGIPVKAEFRNQHLLDEANFSSDFATSPKEILIMGGGLGLIQGVTPLLDSLKEYENYHITVLTGHNQKMYDSLQNKYPHVTCVQYTDKVNEYMKQADLIITKPGGITIFEAINCQTPLLVLPPFLLQEIGNARFVEQEGLGVVAWQTSDLFRLTVETLTNTMAYHDIKEKMAALKTAHDCTSPVAAFRKEETSEQAAKFN